MDNEKLSQLRVEIDEIDTELTALYAKRMEVAKKVALEKDKGAKIIADYEREKKVINRAALSVNPEITAYTKQLYSVILDTSKAYQARFVNPSSKVKDEILAALKNITPFPEYATAACQGVLGSYSNIAADKFLSLSDITFFKSFDGVFNAVQKGLCTYGVLPLENSTAGSVNAVYDLMKKYNFRIVKSLRLPVKHCLLVNKGAKLSDIKEITSHEQALSQCAEYLKKFKDCKITPDENTAVAAQRLVLSGRTDLAVIASEKSGEIYGLSALESGINDNPGNYTRFILIAKDLRLYDKADKISVMMTLPHETGSLNKVLAKFTSVGLNLTKLESRPMPQTAFEFLFYFDFEGDVSSNEVLNLIAELDNSTGLFVFLGAYAEK